KPVYLKDIWPTNAEIRDTINKSLNASMFRKRYSDVFKGPEQWQAIKAGSGFTYTWDNTSTYVQNPPYFVGMKREATVPGDVLSARPLAVLGDSVTTDHISPAGSIKESSPAGKYLIENKVSKTDFNSYG